MTVEDEKGYEIAEKYLIKKYGDDYVDFLEIEGQSYLDGLEESKPKWHDLRKDPNDLPKGDEDCLCFISESYFVGHYVKNDKEWHFDEFISSDVIAWCELPKFEE